MKTYEGMMSYYAVGALLVLRCLCGVEGHPGNDWTGQSITRQSLLVRCSQDWLSLFEICTSSLLGEQKSCSAARPPARPPVVTGKLAPWTLLLFLCFPSVHLSGQRQTTALRRRWMEVVNGPETKKRRRKSGWAGQRVREMYGSAHRLRQSDRWGDYGAGIFSTVVKVREPPCTTQVPATHSGG